MDHPGRAPLWAALIALVEAISALLVPAGPGNLPVSQPLRRRIRLALREAEGRFRRLLLPEAEAHLARLAPARRAPVASEARPSGQAAAASETVTDARRRPPNPFLFRLAESGGGPAVPGTTPPAMARTDRLLDPHGLEKVSARAEFARFARLVVAMETPGPVIHRLALILRRRAARPGAGAGTRRQVSRLPWQAGWRPSGSLDLRPPFYPPPGVDPPWAAGDPSPLPP